ncbi:MAG TPA: glutamyl-tRNA reductase [Acidimicrobiales bacterium]|nr:glutamyl-tRNA reductase [Acidimicrobiales bacterium]
MSVIVVGLEQHQVPLDVLERVTIPEEDLGKTVASLRDRANLAEVVVLSTCMRTELYAVVERFHEGVTDLQEYLAGVAGAPLGALQDHWTVLFDDAVTTHLFEVAAGLRSSVLGETEVLGQVRRALERADAERASGPVLSGLFRHAVQAGRHVRTTTAIAQGATSLSHVAVELAASRLGGSLAGRHVLVVGAGEMGEGMVDALGGHGDLAQVVVANRTARRASILAARVGGTGVGLAGLPEALAATDVVLVSTGAALPVLGPDVLAPACEARAATPGRSPLVVVDLSVPRNVDPAVREVPGVELLDMDDLTEHAERALAGRRAELSGAREIVRQEVERYRAEERARGAAPVVSALRGRMEELRLAELERHRGRLADLDDRQWQEVGAVVRDVLAKLLHNPTVAVKDAAGTPRGERLVEALRTLFDL